MYIYKEIRHIITKKILVVYYSFWATAAIQTQCRPQHQGPSGQGPGVDMGQEGIQSVDGPVAEGREQ